MEETQAKQYLIESLNSLRNELKEFNEEYNQEIDLHFALYHILNKIYPSFWEGKCIEPQFPINRKRIDLCIMDPEDKEGKPLILIEIKFNDSNRVKKTAKNLIKPITKDVESLDAAKRKYPNALAFELYFADDNFPIEKIKKILQEYKKYSLQIEFIIIHASSNDLLFNNQIFENKKQQIHLKIQ